MITKAKFKVSSVGEAERIMKAVIPGDIIVYHRGWRKYWCKETDRLFKYFRKLERGGCHFRRVGGVGESIFVVR